MMRALVVPLVAVGVVLGTYSDEPSERDMRSAFEGALALQVRNALEFAEESGGADAVAKIRDRGMDQFAVNTFRKFDCARDTEKPGYICAFAAEVALANGTMQSRVTGRFAVSQDGLIFVSGI
ncbi:MAG: hypothetical protein HY659_04860 [Rhizobiales bacterium]|nr:hypothetical protein [Hyphomicrobiales bacterium]